MLLPLHASIIPTLISGPTSLGGGLYNYGYTANLQQDERLDPAATNGVTCPGPHATLVQCNPTGTFFTIYDIAGFVSASTTASGWAETLQFTGVTPSTILGSFDDPGVVNVTFFYSGPVVQGGGSLVLITGFNIVSTLNGITDGVFTSQATKNTGSTSGSTDQTSGPVEVPARGSVGGVPEPGTVFLAIGGIAVLLGFRRKRA